MPLGEEIWKVWKYLWRQWNTKCMDAFCKSQKCAGTSWAESRGAMQDRVVGEREFPGDADKHKLSLLSSKILFLGVTGSLHFVPLLALLPTNFFI